MVNCLLLSLLIGKVWAVLMHSSLISPSSEALRCRNGVLYRSARLSASFDKVSHSGLLFKLKSIGEGGNMLSICTEFLSDRRQRVVVDGAASEWI